MSHHLSTDDVARILRMRPARVRALVRSGPLRPARRGRRYAFTFQDLVVLRAARELLEQRVPAARIRRALAALASELPAERPLSGLRIYADGGRVAVCDGEAAWQPETGQTLLHFDVDALAAEAAVVREHAGREGSASEAERAFQAALDLDGVDAEAAARAYRRALALDEGRVDAYVNLGRISHEAGDAGEAVRLYREALERSPNDPIVHFNLALALEDTQGPAAAAPHYERALELDPDFADAHYNLAGLCEQLGRGPDALRHYRAYRDLTEG